MNLNFYLIYIVLSLLGILSASIYLSHKKKAKLSMMSKMMIAMSIGMTSSVCIGLYFGIIFPSDLYHSTLYGIILGILFGLLCVSLFGALAMIEAFFSGLMGGMMGAMLGIMLEPAEAVSLLQFILALSICCLYLYFILERQTSRERGSITKIWLIKPLLSFILLACYIYFGNYLGNDMKHEQPPSLEKPMQDHNH